MQVQGYSKTKDFIIQSSINLMFTSNSFNNVSYKYVWFKRYFTTIVNIVILYCLLNILIKLFVPLDYKKCRNCSQKLNELKLF